MKRILLVLLLPVLTFAQKKDERFALSMRGMMLEKLGNCDLKIFQDKKLHASVRQASLNNALDSYRKAIDLWQVNGVQNSAGVEESGRIEFLKQKINNQKILAKL